MTKYLKKIGAKRIINIYLILYFIFLLLCLFYIRNNKNWIGECDDYSLPVASILNDHNFSINCNDIVYYKNLFPDWSDYIDDYVLSGYITRNGSGEMTWYFPIYAIVCIPYVILLKAIGVSTIFAFRLTNVTVLMIALIATVKILNCEDKQKLILLITLSINPIVIYIVWVSAEVLIFSLLMIALAFWYNKYYKRSAVFLSLAGILNPTVMSIGIIMIIEYFIDLFRNRNNPIIVIIKENIVNIIEYGTCFIIAIIPMIYNYYNTGHINLTASYSGFTQNSETIFSRFVAYLFDLNFGILPYYAVILLISIIMFVFSIIKKHQRYFLWLVSFIFTVITYSIMAHINCGMSGIARYSSWGVLPLIFAVILFGKENIKTDKCLTTYNFILFVGVILTSINILFTGTLSYKYFTPVAKIALDNLPSVYNPLHSTFNSRVNHIEGGYNIITPVVYYGEDNYIRKILATSADKEVLLNIYYSDTGYDQWFIDKVNKLDEDMTYINIPKKYGIKEINDIN